MAPTATATYVKGVKKRPMLLKHIPYPAHESAKLTILKVARTDVAHNIGKWPNQDFIRQLQEFLIKLAIAQAKPSDHGISWVELTILFEMRQGMSVHTDRGQTQHIDQTYKRHAPVPKLVPNFSVATRRILEARPGGWPENAKRYAIAATGHRMRSLGSLSSTASVGFAAHATREEYYNNQRALVMLHGIKGGNLVSRLYAGNLWSTHRNSNLRQGRPYTVPAPRTSNSDHGRNNMHAIPIADIPGTQPPEVLAKRPRHKKDGNNKDDGNGQTAPHTTNICISKGVEDQAGAYGLLCPYGCGQITWRDTKPNIPLGATQTNQARIGCKECNKDFHVNERTRVLCSTNPSYCICTKKKPPRIGRQRNLAPLQDWMQPAENKQKRDTHNPPRKPRSSVTTPNLNLQHNKAAATHTSHPRKSMM